MSTEHSEQIHRSFLILIMVMAPLICGCDEDPRDTTTPNPCDCDCEGGYDISGFIPDSYNCDSAGCFAFKLTPAIDNCYFGLNAMWLELENDQRDIYRSNAIVFYPMYTQDHDFIFGGSLPTGTYSAYAQMIDFQACCPDSICKRRTGPLGDIDITECSSIDKEMIIEYGYQYDTPAAVSYDLFQSPNLSEYINIAFNAANTSYSLQQGEIGIEAELIVDSSYPIYEYIDNHKITTNLMYLCGVKGFKDRNGNFLSSLWGTTLTPDTITFEPTGFSGSLVAYYTCSHAVDTIIYAESDDIINKVSIHELGHQRGVISHYDHQTYFCAMRRSFIYKFSSGYLYRAPNPLFCSNCITKIKAITW